MKKYTSEAWLRRKYYRERKSVQQIAAEAGVSEMTIRRYLEKFGLVKKR